MLLLQSAVLLHSFSFAGTYFHHHQHQHSGDTFHCVLLLLFALGAESFSSTSFFAPLCSVSSCCRHHHARRTKSFGCCRRKRCSILCTIASAVVAFAVLLSVCVVNWQLALLDNALFADFFFPSFHRTRVIIISVRQTAAASAAPYANAEATEVGDRERASKQCTCCVPVMSTQRKMALWRCAAAAAAVFSGLPSSSSSSTTC